MSKMADISPKTFPIALALVGGSIVIAAVISEHLDLTFRYIIIFLGLIFILAGVVLYVWERSKWYDYALSFPYPVSLFKLNI